SQKAGWKYEVDATVRNHCSPKPTPAKSKPIEELLPRVVSKRLSRVSRATESPTSEVRCFPCWSRRFWLALSATSEMGSWLIRYTAFQREYSPRGCPIRMSPPSEFTV